MYNGGDRIVESHLMHQYHSSTNSSMFISSTVLSFSFVTSDLCYIAESLRVEISLPKVGFWLQ